MDKHKKKCAKVEYSDNLFKEAITDTIGDIYYAQGTSRKDRIS